MAIFNKSKDTIQPVDKGIIINDIIHDCPAEWQIIEGNDVSYDLLIIRTVSKEVKITINALNPHTRHEDMDLQQVFAVTIANKASMGNEEDFVDTRGWTTAHIVTSSVDKLLRRIKEYD